MAQSLEYSKTFLQNGDKDGFSLYDHLSELLLHLVDNKPEDAWNQFEKISKEVKSSTFIQQPVKQVALDEKNAPQVLDSSQAHAVQKVRQLLKNQISTSSQSTVIIPNSIEESFHYSRLGVGLGQEELLQIYLYLKQYFSTLPLQSARFFGKIYGLEKNYYVVEADPLPSFPPYEDNGASLPKEPPIEEPVHAPVGEVDPDEPKTPPPKLEKVVEEPPKEEREERTPNQYIYFITYGPSDPWIRLPDVTPELIRASRTITKTLTGNLDAVVSLGYPSFPGLEKHLLRALIARISHATTIIPRAFVGDGQEEEGGETTGRKISIAEGLYPVVNVNSLMEENQWVHSRPPILKQGRVRRWPLPKAEGEEEEQNTESNPPPEEGEEGLGVDLKITKGIEEDEKLWDGRIPSFSFRKDNVVPDSPLLLRSNVWPGAYTLVYGGKRAVLSSVYIGYGNKYTSLPYTVPPPPTLPEEYPDMDEKIDPTVDEEDRARAAQEEAAIDVAKGETEEEEEQEEEEL